MNEELSEWRKGVMKALVDGDLSEDNNVALGMATAMRAGRKEADMTFAEGYEAGKDVARRCKYHQR